MTEEIDYAALVDDGEATTDEEPKPEHPVDPEDSADNGNNGINGDDEEPGPDASEEERFAWLTAKLLCRLERRPDGELVVRTRCRECQVGIALPCRISSGWCDDHSYDPEKVLPDPDGREVVPTRAALNLASLVICDVCQARHEERLEAWKRRHAKKDEEPAGAAQTTLGGPINHRGEAMRF